jgi:calcineurin-like phosphoesterase family protein
MHFFTSDQHFGHKNIINYSSRQFESVEEMNDRIISNHNEVVKKGDVVYHLGDFTLEKDAWKYLKHLNGVHNFVKGSHDIWMKNQYPYLREIKYKKQNITLCHYAMRRWAKSHYGSWQLYGHSHGHLEPIGKQWDVGVDANNFYPVSFDQIKDIMDKQPDNEINHPR